MIELLLVLVLMTTDLVPMTTDLKETETAFEERF
jgi:hypothetical protein